MFGISFEHLLVLGIILLFVGPRRLPELGNTLGKAIKNFKDAVSGIEDAKFRKIRNTTDAAEILATKPETDPSETTPKADPTHRGETNNPT